MVDQMNIKKLAGLFRISEWWEVKFTHFLAFVFLTAAYIGISLNSLGVFLSFLLISLIPGAIYVSVINDLTDFNDDRIAHKKNNFEAYSKGTGIGIALLCILSGIAILWFLPFRSSIFYLSAWVSYSFYSIPPIRLKKRGFFGTAADSLGANVFPTLYAVTLVFEWFAVPIDWHLIILAFLWSFTWGLRGIIWHQLADKGNDVISGIDTFATHRNSEVIVKWIKWLVFPIEIASLIAVLLWTKSSLGFIFLAINLLIAFFRLKAFSVKTKIMPVNRLVRLLMADYYRVWLPVSCLLIMFHSYETRIFGLTIYFIIFPVSICREIYEICLIGAFLSHQTRKYLNWEI